MCRRSRQPRQTGGGGPVGAPGHTCALAFAPPRLVRVATGTVTGRGAAKQTSV